MADGQIIVFTGDGKGKTSAALGVALRACGRKMQVSMVQFIKSSSSTGEELMADRLKPEFELITIGRGFVNLPGDKLRFDDHVKEAQIAFDIARQRITSGFWDLVILDEINNAVELGLIDISHIIDLLKIKPRKLHVILTGRNAHPDLVAIADMVSEMRSIKHPFDQGRPAQAGIDF